MLFQILAGHQMFHPPTTGRAKCLSGTQGSRGPGLFTPPISSVRRRFMAGLRLGRVTPQPAATTSDRINPSRPTALQGLDVY